MADYLEIEQKFDVNEDFEQPDFGALRDVLDEDVTAGAPVRHQLRATYFDTPDERLAASKVTLRRRTGGTDAGWHLKLPAGPDARSEVRAPLTPGSAEQDTVPSELRDVVLAIVRDRPLEPVARIATERETQVLYGAEGSALAEFSNDRVTAWSAGASDGPDSLPAEQEWREWELELVERNGTADTELLSR